MDLSVKAEQTDNMDLSKETKPPATPRKRNKNIIPVESDAESPTKKSKTKSPTKNAGPFGPIPTSYEEARVEDKMIIQLKETAGKTWAEIRKALEDFTGVKIGSSTPHVRYARMKANFVVFNAEDEPRLLQKKKEIEEKMEQEKWQRIADGIEAMGGSKYPSSTVQKKYKQMAKNGNGIVAGAGKDE